MLIEEIVPRKKTKNGLEELRRAIRSREVTMGDLVWALIEMKQDPTLRADLPTAVVAQYWEALKHLRNVRQRRGDRSRAVVIPESSKLPCKRVKIERRPAGQTWKKCIVCQKAFRPTVGDAQVTCLAPACKRQIATWTSRKHREEWRKEGGAK